MADFSWTDLLSFGFVMFAATLLGLTRRKAGRSLARREYPKLASEMGLRFQPPTSPREVGRIVGEMDGLRVRIESDERARLVCSPGPSGIDVRSYPHHKRTPAGYELFSLGNHADDGWMPNRFARDQPALDPVLAGLRALLDALRPDRDRLREFTANAERIECVFNFGAPAYLPASVVRRVFPKMLELSRTRRGGEREPTLTVS